MEAPIIYYDPTSEPCRAVHWLCLELNAPFELKFVWLTRNEHLSQDFLRINPFHQVPAMECGSFCLSEAVAIMQYLTDANDCRSSWFGSGIEESAIVSQSLSWYHTNLRKILTLDYFLPVLLMPAYLGVPKPSAAVISERRELLHTMLGQLDSMLANKPFLAGTKISAADILFASELAALEIDPEQHNILASFTHIEHWLLHLRASPNYQKSHSVWHHIAPQIMSAISEPHRSSPEWIAQVCEEFAS
ncbi:MAG: glutathione S-transferase family protein [Halioglobus sp.]